MYGFQIEFFMLLKCHFPLFSQFQYLYKKTYAPFNSIRRKYPKEKEIGYIDLHFIRTFFFK